MPAKLCLHFPDKIIWGDSLKFCCSPWLGMSLPSPGSARCHTHTLLSAQNVQDGLAKSKVLSGLQQHCIWKARVKKEGTAFPLSSITYPKSWELGSIPFICQGMSETPSATTLLCFSCMTFSLKQLLHSATNNLEKLRFLFQFTACVRQKTPTFLPSELSGFS